MDSLDALIAGLRLAWRALFPGVFERGAATAGVYLVVLFVAVWAIEKACGTRTRNYRTRGFGQDVAYYFYYRSGAHRILFTAAVFSALDGPLSFLDLKLLTPLPPLLQIVAALLVTDFAMYWLHRAQHRFRFLWAFHSTHHSQENLTFASYLRFHPVEVFVGECVSFVMLKVLGFDFASWFVVYLVANLVGELTHTQIPWKLGLLSNVIVTPRFHSYHHSPDRALHDRNFGGLFSFWDRLFGTAVPEATPVPVKFGLPDVKSSSLWASLATPFYMLRDLYLPARPLPPEPEARSSTAVRKT